jgi:hypothetical protein
MFELNGGLCQDDDCQAQHFGSTELDEWMRLQVLVSYLMQSILESGVDDGPLLSQLGSVTNVDEAADVILQARAALIGLYGNSINIGAVLKQE